MTSAYSDYPPVPTEVLIMADGNCHYIEYYTTTDIDEQTITAYYLEIMEKVAYEFEKRITRPMIGSKPKKSNHISKKRKSHIRTSQRFHQ